MEFIIENIGLIGLVLIILAIFNKYRNINSSKNKENIEEKELNSFQKWWQQSYIKEIYFVRTKQRIVISLIPIIGIFTSIFAINWFSITSYNVYNNPTQPFDKLIKYDGVVKGYSYHKKSSDILSLQLDSGEIENFNSLIYIKDKDPKNWIEKKVSIWVERKIKSSFQNYETAVWIEFDGKNIDKDVFEQQYQERLKLDNNQFGNLILSLQWFVGFLFLLWFINIKPVNNNIEHSQLKIAIVSILGVVLFFVSILIFLVLGTH